MPDQDRLPKLKVIRDNPEVQVRGDIGFALRILRRKVQLCGNHRVLNLRRKYPERPAAAEGPHGDTEGEEDKQTAEAE